MFRWEEVALFASLHMPGLGVNMTLIRLSYTG